MKLTSKKSTLLSSSISSSTLKLENNNDNKSRTFSLYRSNFSTNLIYQLITVLLSLTLIDNFKLYVNANSINMNSAPCGQINNLYNKNQNQNHFNTIQPLFEIYKPNGIRISLPKLDIDMTSFEFHANVNELIALDEMGTINGKGNFSNYWGQWYIYLNEPTLNINDRINYWYEIKYNGTIMRRFKLAEPYIVKYQIPVSPNYEFFDNKIEDIPINHLNNEYQLELTTPNQQSLCDCNTNIDEINKLEKEIIELKTEIKEVQNEIIPILADINILKRLIGHQYDEKNNFNRKLLLTNEKKLPYNNPIDEVRFVISEKLRLSELAPKIVQAEYNSCGILFEMISPYDKQHLLLQAQTYLKKSQVKILEPNDSNKCVKLHY